MPKKISSMDVKSVLVDNDKIPIIDSETVVPEDKNKAASILGIKNAIINSNDGLLYNQQRILYEDSIAISSGSEFIIHDNWHYMPTKNFLSVFVNSNYQYLNKDYVEIISEPLSLKNKIKFTYNIPENSTIEFILNSPTYI